MDSRQPNHEEDEGPIEIALVGDLTDHETEISERLLSVPHGGECTLFIDSPGGSPYCAIAITTLIRLRSLRATAIVIGECSSAALWPLAACERRVVTPFSVLLFHPMKWQSEEHIGLDEAAEWARHFKHLETEMDGLLASLLSIQPGQIEDWINPGRYVTGREFAEAKLADLIELRDLKNFSAENGIRLNAQGADNGNGTRASSKTGVKT